MYQPVTAVAGSDLHVKTVSLPLLANAGASGAAFDWPGGTGAFVVDRGSFGGATVKLQFSIDGAGTWLDVDAAGDTYVTFTAASAGLFDLPACAIRAQVEGGTPSGLYATAKGVRA